MIRNYLLVFLLFFYSECPFIAQEVTINMNIPEQIRAGSDFTVEIELDKGKRIGIARFQQVLPKGMTASAINSANADFNFERNKVTLVWLKLPVENTLIFVYSIHTNKGIKGEFSIGGKFSFIEMDDREDVEITPRTIKILPLSADNQTGITFRVQILASRKPIKGNQYFKSRNIPGQIQTEFINGWYRYTTGSFKHYFQAREYLIQIQKNSGIIGAFVCAYQEGVRIPLKLALELTNQR
jgi:hypothetical protein